jgi:diacylglycerol kinase (ATP)
MSFRWLAIVNPTAGGGRAGRRWQELARALRARGVLFDAITTVAAGDATAQARKAHGDFDGLIAVGGDGTVHEVVNGLSLERSPVLAVAPYGTGNDFARGLQLPRTATALAELIATPRRVSRRIGEVRYGARGHDQARRFVNGVGVGLDAAVLARLPTAGPRALAYLVGTLRALRHFRAADAVVTCDGQTCEGRYLLLYAGLGTHAGGGMQITPHARRVPEALALTLVPDAPLARILRLLPALYGGTLDRTPWLQCRHATHVQVESEGFGLEADGQLLGRGPITISLLPERLRVIAAHGQEADNEGLSTEVHPL